MSELTNKHILDFLEEHLSIHDGGNPPIIISWDDATRDYSISQKNGYGPAASMKTLGCSKSLFRAFELAISGKVYDEE